MGEGGQQLKRKEHAEREARGGKSESMRAKLKLTLAIPLFSSRALVINEKRRRRRESHNAGTAICFLGPPAWFTRDVERLELLHHHLTVHL